LTLAERVDNVIHITTSYQERHLTAQIPGANFSKDLNVWKAPLSWATCVAMRGVFKKNLEIGPILAEWSWNVWNTRINPANSMRNALELEDYGHSELNDIEEGHTLKLFPYQQVDAEFMVVNRRALLANPPGLGKTGATIRTLQLLKARGENPYPAVIICPNSLKFTVWQEGFQQWAPEVSAVVIDGTPAKRRKQLAAAKDWAASNDTVVILNWEAVRLHSRLAPYGNIALTDAETAPKELNSLGHKTVIFDEAHKMKDPAAKQTRAAWYVAHQATNRYALTGTPVANDISDMWGILHAIEPTWFPSKTKFISRYAALSHNYFGGAEVVGLNAVTQDELFAIVDPIMRRLPKEAALPQLPPKLPVQYRHTPMTPKQQKAYDQMRDMMIAQLNEILVAPNPLSKLTRLLQFASASAEISEVKIRTSVEEFHVTLTSKDIQAMLNEHGDEILLFEDMMFSAIRKYFRASDKRRPRFLRAELKFEAGQRVALFREVKEEYQDVLLTDPSSKVDDMVELLDEMGEDSLVVGAVSRQLIEIAARRLDKLKIPHGLVTGAQTPLERQQAVKDFQDGKTRVILLTLGAGAEGLTLTRADTMLFMQRSWSEIQNAQAEDRIHRIGSEHHSQVRIIEQITPDSVEENKRSLLEGKQMRMEEVVRDAESLLKLLGAK
jgi:SNF2 family DNA or RNA helicase